MKNLENVVLIAANLQRSQAYVQALQNKGFHIGSIIIMNPPGKQVEKVARSLDRKQPVGAWVKEGMHLPDFSIPLEKTCDEICNKVISIEANHVNDALVTSNLKELNPEIVIYSGFGGQIVGNEALEIAPFLHIHSGWLPDYRGSTTLYYSIIKEARCGVSAILLDAEIDTGAIVAKQHFEAPPYGTDLDHLYDGSIRAYVLIDVLNDWITNGEFSCQEEQRLDDGDVYYVIHPVLKHIAICGLKAE